MTSAVGRSGDRRHVTLSTSSILAAPKEASAPRALGRSGEDLAAAWYEHHGYDVLARNWRCRAGELDIVARRGRLIVFCEVKSRTSEAFGLPAEAVGPVKQARLRRLAALWFADRALSGRGRRAGGPVRFDVAGVLAGEVEVIEGAF
jgi:putative endonuclease